MRQWVQLQDEFETFYFIPNMHGITTPHDPKALRERIAELAKEALAGQQQAAHAGIHQAINPPDELVARAGRARQVRQRAHSGVLRDFLNEGRGSFQPPGALRAGHSDVIGVIAFQDL